MSEAVIKNTKLEIDNFCNLIDKLEGYPKPPTSQFGGSDPLNISQDTPGLGWSLKYCEPIQHPSLLTWAFVIDQKILDDSIDSDFTSNLTSGELTSLQSDLSSRTTLDSSWFPEV